ncbi:metallophosphoesterase family protein [Actinokineospora xionganensis]|uniref:Metallophosphoesterase n=1 Tax=Actinokineospora xionganensis TaxID=2684470 RepID=A0ABR7KYV7_9PSEU|nr:metallophosphoesterase [Actinokineospora xionganensis]MBC6445631.1 metallophosphoesterase [Actinokineospora xionganensis]
MIRIAAIGDVHLSKDTGGRFRPALRTLDEHADALLLAGDLTRHGTVEEAKVVAAEFGSLSVPVVAVLGNHDYHSNRSAEVTEVLADAGISVLEGQSAIVPVDGRKVGIAGVKGFGGGFAGKCASAFGEPEIKAFVEHTEVAAAKLRGALEAMDCDVRIALTHYSPVSDTLRGEPPEIYPFLGCYQLGEAIDSCDTALAIHGHAHYGTEQGFTPGGVRVRNVAHPIIRAAYAIYCIE